MRSKFQHKKQLKNIADTVLTLARKKGATQAEISAAMEEGFTVNVRMGETDTVEYHQSNTVGITVYFDKKTASVTASDLSDKVLHEAVNKACEIVQFTESDPCMGLAEKELMATEFPDLQLYHPWEITVPEAIEKSLACEAIGLDRDKRIKNSEGVSLSTQTSEHLYANSHGFLVVEPVSRHSMMAIFIAEQNGEMERDYAQTIVRDSNELLSGDLLAELTASRVVNRLGAKPISTKKTPVIFSAEVARGLVGSFLNAISGSLLYRKSSFLLDHLGKQVFSKAVNLFERPYLAKALGSSSYDTEGVATRNQHFVKEGILENYILNTYTARQMGMKTTANAGGTHNCFITSGELDFSELLSKMDRGLLVTELFGQGVSLVTGDYSRGAFGYWVENGNVQYPVSGITIAGNLRDMFLGVVAISNDLDCNGNIQIGSILIDEMMVAGS